MYSTTLLLIAAACFTTATPLIDASSGISRLRPVRSSNSRALIPRSSCSPSINVTDIVGTCNSTVVFTIASDECDAPNTVTSIIGTSSSRVVYTVAGTVQALSICQLLRNRGWGGIGTDDCGPIATFIGATLAIIFTATNTGSEAAPGQSTRRAAQSLTDALLDLFNDDAMFDYSFDSITSVDPDVNTDREMPMLRQAVISGLRHGDNPAADLVWSDFGQGYGHVRVQAAAGNASLAARSEHNGPGFKINYTSRLPSELTRAHQRQMSGAIADDWANRANRDHIGDYDGFVETGEKANFYWRIIAEDHSFGSNYESVNFPCGGMGQYLPRPH